MKLILLDILLFTSFFSFVYSSELALPPREGSVNWQTNGTYVVDEHNQASILEALILVQKTFGNTVEEASTESMQLYSTLLCKQNVHEDSEFLAFIIPSGKVLPFTRVCYKHEFSRRMDTIKACYFLGMHLLKYDEREWKFTCKPNVVEMAL